MHSIAFFYDDANKGTVFFVFREKALRNSGFSPLQPAGNPGMAEIACARIIWT